MGCVAGCSSPASRLATIQGPRAAPILAVSAALESTVASAWTRLFGTMVLYQLCRQYRQSLWAKGIAESALRRCPSTRSGFLYFTSRALHTLLANHRPSPRPHLVTRPSSSPPTSPDPAHATTHIQQLMVHRPTLKQLRDKHFVPLPGPLVREQLGIWVHAKQVRDKDDPVDFAVALPVLGR